MVMFKDDFDTFCKYLAVRPPNGDRTVHQHLEDRHLEKAIRGMYYLAHYRHQPDAGEVITVALDQYCGRVDPDAQTDAEARATAHKIKEIHQRVVDAVTAVGATVHEGPVKYTGEVLLSP